MRRRWEWLRCRLERSRLKKKTVAPIYFSNATFISAELSGERTRGKTYRTTSKVVTYIWKNTFAKLGEDWVFLAVLGIVMAIISYIMDNGIEQCGSSRMKLYSVVKDQKYNLVVQFLAWCILPVFLVLFAAGFVHLVAPQAVGSGIPEMKTVMRGVVLKEYLTVKTLIAKMVGLTATLGSGMPLGKVHMVVKFYAL